MSLVELLNRVTEEEEAMTKQAQEEEAAGRIMARGFMDELSKLAQANAVGKVKPFMKSITTAAPGGGSKTEFAPKNTVSPSGNPMTTKSSIRSTEPVKSVAKSLGGV